MKTIYQQLYRWRLYEWLIRLGCGTAYWLCVMLIVLAAACALDWCIDRYSGSQTWRDWRRSSWLLWPADPLATGETPFWTVRCPLTLGQLVLAALLAWAWILRPVRHTPSIDDLAFQAEQAFPEFDHRLVTAVQLNRRSARTQGMSQALIAQLTQEAEQLATQRRFLTLLDTSRLSTAVAWVLPPVLCWSLFFLVNPALARVLVLRQALLPLEIPRRIHLENITPEIWPVGAQVDVRLLVRGRYTPDMVGVLRLVPDEQPEEYYDLTFQSISDEGEAIFGIHLPPQSRDFSFQARLGDGRTTTPGRVRFEPPPQLAPEDPQQPPLMTEIELPEWLGRTPSGQPYVRRNQGWNRGDAIDVLPGSVLRIAARFNKPLVQAHLIPLLRTGAHSTTSLPPLPPLQWDSDRTAATWRLPVVDDLVAYRLQLEDHYGFRNPLPIQRNIRLWDDRPPVVELKPESTRDPDRNSPDWAPGVQARDFEWDMPLPLNGRIQVIYSAFSPAGISSAQIAYRVVPRGIPADAYPEDIRRIQHPHDDPNGLVFQRLPLRPFTGDPHKLGLGEFIPDLGKFEKSGRFGEVEFYRLPSEHPEQEPPGLTAGGCKNFEVAGLQKRLPDGSWAPIEVGDTVELYVEVYDRLRDAFPTKPRTPGYPREPKRKIVVTEADAELAFRLREQGRQRLRDKLQQIAEDQANIFRPRKQP
jgi:hypothetical protein